MTETFIWTLLSGRGRQFGRNQNPSLNFIKKCKTLQKNCQQAVPYFLAKLKVFGHPPAALHLPATHRKASPTKAEQRWRLDTLPKDAEARTDRPERKEAISAKVLEQPRACFAGEGLDATPSATHHRGSAGNGTEPSCPGKVPVLARVAAACSSTAVLLSPHSGRLEGKPRSSAGTCCSPSRSPPHCARGPSSTQPP